MTTLTPLRTGCCKITPKTETTFEDGVLTSKFGLVRVADSGIDYVDPTYLDDTLTARLEDMVEHAGASTDNAVARWDGTDGGHIQNSGVIISDTDEISGYAPNIKTVSDTTYTAVASDTGKILAFTHVDGCAVSIPDLGAWGVTLVAMTAGTVSVAGAGATVHAYDGAPDLAGQYAAATIFGVGGGVYILAGNLA